MNCSQRWYSRSGLDFAKIYSNKQFGQILLEAIDQALSSLGENAKESVYFHMERKSKITRQEIPNRIDDFSDSLERIFGLGARHLEIMFMKNLHAKVKTVYKMDTPTWVVPELTFNEYVRNVKQNFEEAPQERGRNGDSHK